MRFARPRTQQLARLEFAGLACISCSARLTPFPRYRPRLLDILGRVGHGFFGLEAYLDLFDDRADLRFLETIVEHLQEFAGWRLRLLGHGRRPVHLGLVGLGDRWLGGLDPKLCGKARDGVRYLVLRVLIRRRGRLRLLGRGRHVGLLGIVRCGRHRLLGYGGADPHMRRFQESRVVQGVVVV